MKSIDEISVSVRKEAVTNCYSAKLMQGEVVLVSMEGYSDYAVAAEVGSALYQGFRFGAMDERRNDNNAG